MWDSGQYIIIRQAFFFFYLLPMFQNWYLKEEQYKYTKAEILILKRLWNFLTVTQVDSSRAEIQTKACWLQQSWCNLYAKLPHRATLGHENRDFITDFHSKCCLVLFPLIFLSFSKPPVVCVFHDCLVSLKSAKLILTNLNSLCSLSLFSHV